MENRVTKDPFNKNSSTLYNFGIIAVTTMTVIIYLSRN